MIHGPRCLIRSVGVPSERGARMTAEQLAKVFAGEALTAPAGDNDRIIGYVWHAATEPTQDDDERTAEPTEVLSA